jgi:hypothetical protein
MKYKLILVFVSTFITLLFIYIGVFTKVSLEKRDQSYSSFKSYQSLNFHKKYSNILNHLRNVNLNWDYDGNQENFLFSVINDFNQSKKNILLQGDSWMEQINLENQSLKNITNYSKKNNFGIINAGITSFSPTLMKLQYEILKKDFNIHPDIVIAYIDQTDIGDEICRYKKKRYFNSENKLIGVKQNEFSRGIYDYFRIYRSAEINLSKNNKFIKNIKRANLQIEFKVKRAIKKLNNFRSYGYQNVDEARCYFSEIQKYLKNDLNNSDEQYFQNRLGDYLKAISNDTKIEKILIVTFPHKNNFLQRDHKEHYKVNVSNLVDKELKKIKNLKIKHINFTKLLKDNSKFNFTIYRKDDAASHLNETPHNEIFVSEILENIRK